jgi:lysophospholipase L1-like esterase
MRVPTPKAVSTIIWILLGIIALGQPAAAGSTMATSEVLGAQAAPADAAYRGKPYVALGDSISAGRYATTPDRVFPALIAQQLGMSLTLAAKSGAKAAWALPQLASIDQMHPALVTIELGTNDVGFNTPLADFSSQYEAIVAALSVPGTRVICIGSWLPSAVMDGVIADSCQRHGGTFVSLAGFYGDNSLHAADGQAVYLGRADWFHPGDAGHAAIAQAVMASLGAAPTTPEPEVTQPQPPSPPGGPDVLRIIPR